MKMGPGSAELWISESKFPVPGCIGEIKKGTWSIGEREAGGVNNNPPAAIPEGGPTVRVPKNTFRRQLSCSHFFIAPKKITLRVSALCQQTVREPDGLYGFIIVNGPHFDPGLFLKGFKNRFGIDLIL